MRTLIVDIPEKDKNMVSTMLKRMGYRSRFVSEREKEEVALAKWIHDGLDSENVSMDLVRKAFRKNGVDL